MPVKVAAILLLTALAAHAAPSDPGKVAVDFLEKVRQKNVDLGSDTALSTRTTPHKRRQIAKRLDRLADDLGSEPLEVGTVRLDDDLAAVLVRKAGGFDPGNQDVFPVALVRRNAEWQPAPVPASFENVGTDYALALRKRAEDLENWMLRQQVVDLEKLKSQTAEKMRDRIREKLSASHLRSFDARQIADHFLVACAAGDVPTALGLVGGLGEKLPADWSLRLRSVEAALKNRRDATPAWRPLVAPQVARAVVLVEDDGDSGLFSVAFLDPNGSGSGIERKPPRIQVIHFNLARSADKLWRIDLPTALLSPSPLQDEDEPGANPDAALIEAFPAAWRAAHAATPEATAEAVREAWFGAVNRGDFSAFLATADLSAAPASAAKACERAAREWWKILSREAASLALPLAFNAEQDTAVAICQTFTPRDADKHDLWPVYFTRSAEGWMWQPHATEETRAPHAAWLNAERERLAKAWQEQVLAACPVIAKNAALPAPTEDAARQCVSDLLSASTRGDLIAALGQVCRLDSVRSGSTALRNLGYEITGARDILKPATIAAVYAGKSFTAVAVDSHRSDGTPAFPLYPVVMTASGPRVLVETDLFATANRSRFFLNKDALERLSEATSKDSAADLQSLLDRHQSAVDEASP
ncbi:MAG: hypothetical protein V4640_05835 [Verrucomicrobiota bacterium]